MSGGQPPEKTDRDWASDFDHADPSYNERAPEVWADLRARCPVAHTPRYGGMWVPVTHAGVREIAYDTTHFTSKGVIVRDARPEVPSPEGSGPPITSDPPFHREAKRLLLPPFAPRKIEALEGDVRAVCRDLLDRIAPAPGRVFDAAFDYAQRLPAIVIGRMLGFPPEDEDMFRGFVCDLLESFEQSEDEQREFGTRLDAYVDAQIADHRAHPRDDLTSYLIDARIGGAPLSTEHVRGSITLLLIAGIDTTWSAIGSSLWHLARHPGDLARLVAEPELMSTAVEEMLRVYAPVTIARMVAKDHDFHGCAFRKDDWVLLPFPAANHDPSVFERADEVVLDREVNPHVAFGLGIHRCLGSNLARLELRVALEEFIRRVPAFTLAGPEGVVWSVGQIRGPRRLPVRAG